MRTGPSSDSTCVLSPPLSALCPPLSALPSHPGGWEVREGQGRQARANDENEGRRAEARGRVEGENDGESGRQEWRRRATARVDSKNRGRAKVRVDGENTVAEQKRGGERKARTESKSRSRSGEQQARAQAEGGSGSIAAFNLATTMAIGN
ncbi:hypothetical protein BT69DRAFT_1305712 [Atractiella rhizophila]|nr:hypothetical protein BT69DRAFT_1305712 [Atractiella rhizophila]